MKPKIVLLNGPAKCGKGFSIDYIKKHGYPNITVSSCKEHLHELTMKFFNVEGGRYYEIYNDRDLKEKPLGDFKIRLQEEEAFDLFYDVLYVNPPYSTWDIEEDQEGTYFYEVNLSIRQAMIYVSEILCKPRFGSDYFGRVRADKVGNSSSWLHIDDSASAFNVGGTIVCDEVPPLIEQLGQENVLLIRIHREGFTFEGDSREYIPDGVVDNTVDLYNVDEDEFYEEVLRTVKSFVGD